MSLWICFSLKVSMNNLLNQIKEAILDSEQLLEKSKNFEKLKNKYFGKDYDDFSFTVTDQFEIDLNSTNVGYEIEYIKSEEDISEFSYFNIIKHKLEEITFDDSNLNFYDYLKLTNQCVLKINIEARIGYSSEKDSFILLKNVEKSLKTNNITCHKKRIENLFEIISKNDDDVCSLGFVKTENHALEILEKLTNIKEYLMKLDVQIKNELFSNFAIIRNAYGNQYPFKDESFLGAEKVICDLSNSSKISLFSKDFISSNKERNNIIELWLDKNCKSEYRRLISANYYNIYFSNKDNWLSSIIYLSEDYQFSFEKSVKKSLALVKTLTGLVAPSGKFLGRW